MDEFSIGDPVAINEMPAVIVATKTEDGQTYYQVRFEGDTESHPIWLEGWQIAPIEVEETDPDSHDAVG